MIKRLGDDVNELRNKKQEDRKITLLKACKQLLEKQDKSHYVLNLLDEIIYYDEAECDGSCLLEDINIQLEEEAHKK